MDKTLKYSRQREYLVQLLQNTKSHPDANWLYLEMKKQFNNVSQATIYRNLKLLTKLGKISKIRTCDGSEHYDITTNQHYHFMCETCSKIDDINMAAIEWLNSDVQNKHKAKVKSHSLIFYGVCADCLYESGE